MHQHPFISTGKRQLVRENPSVHTIIDHLKLLNEFTILFTCSHLHNLYIAGKLQPWLRRLMSNRKIKIEFSDNEGSKYSISLEGRPSKDKLNKIMEAIEELDTDNTNTQTFNLDTTFNKTLKLIEDKYPLGSFTSSDVLEAFEDEYNNPIKLSTVSTYLTRLLEKGHLQRERIGNTWVYKKIKIHLQQ